MNDSTHHGYRSPLEERNASREMRSLFSAQRKFGTWRRVWHALATAEHELGLPVTAAQVAAIGAHLDDIDFDAAARHERALRHDLMAHVHTLGDAAPEARAIIHLGATSQDVVCNADAILMREALDLVAVKLARAIDRLGRFAATHRALPCLGFTHYQPAQPVTVGKRACLWAYDLVLALADIEHRRDTLALRGLRGATGTQASFLQLCGNDPAKVDALERRFAQLLGWTEGRLHPVCGQTYTRVVDAQVLSSLAAAAAAIHKCATDIRLLANLKELEEPFEKDQIGSSAMPYKRNPMRCERACGLARFVMSLPQNALDTAAVQWLERSLDDSSNRRLSIAESFLALDGALDLICSVVDGLAVYPHQVRTRLMAELPFMASEAILMAAVERGADRQDAHERIRVHSVAAAAQVKEHGKPNDLLERIAGDPVFAGVDLGGVTDPSRFVGRAPEQVDAFLSCTVADVRRRYGGRLDDAVDLRV
jgi:adenylosuccinate lyase